MPGKSENQSVALAPGASHKPMLAEWLWEAKTDFWGSQAVKRSKENVYPRKQRKREKETKRK